MKKRDGSDEKGCKEEQPGNIRKQTAILLNMWKTKGEGVLWSWKAFWTQFLPKVQESCVGRQILCHLCHLGRGSWVAQTLKESGCSGGDLGSIPGSGRSPRKGNGYQIQYSCLENSMDRGAWQATIYGVAKSRTWWATFTFTSFCRKMKLSCYSPADTIQGSLPSPINRNWHTHTHTPQKKKLTRNQTRL